MIYGIPAARAAAAPAPGAVYEGTTSAGGTVRITINADGTAALSVQHPGVGVGCAPASFTAGAVALALPPSYYQKLAADYRERRDVLLAGLRAAGFRCFVPRGAYYIMADITAFGFVQHNFFILFNAAIGLIFLRRATADLFGAPATTT